MDYSFNCLEKLTFSPKVENITSLEVQENRIKKIDGPSLKLLKNISLLNMKDNLLSIIPPELESLSFTKVFLEGNRFQCTDCEIVRILKSITWDLPQNLRHDKIIKK